MLMILTMSVLPALVLLWYIYRLDRIEQEPGYLIKKLFFAGVLSTLAAMAAELIGTIILGLFVKNQESALYRFLFFFIVVAVAEEVVKYIPLRRICWYHPEFNFRFDAVVYAATVSLGFAAAENVMYALGFGVQVVALRAVTAIPLHCITGIFMGHYLGQAKFMEGRRDWSGMTVYNVLSILVPVLLHGYYDFCQSMENTLFASTFLIFVVVLDILAFIFLHHYARTDTTVS